MKNLKKNYKRFRELWAVPKYKTRFKLAGWFIFFFLFFLLFIVTESIKPPREENNNVETVLSFNKMKSDLLKANLLIEYNITGVGEFFIEGTLIDNSISGTIETEELTNKIRITDEEVFIVRNKTEEKTHILNELNLLFLFPKHIIEIIDANSSTLKTNEEERIFTYDLENKLVSVHTIENEINKIIIIDGLITYELKMNIIN